MSTEREELEPLDRLPGPWRVRATALLALLAFATAVAVIVASSGRSSAPSDAPVASGVRRAYWHVRSGQTLSLIARREGIPLSRLEALNPRLDASTLRAGERVRVR